MDTLTPTTFRFPSVLVPTAQHISLLGPFNKWTRGVHPLASTGNGWWIVTVRLPPGRVAYCFDVDGTTWLDPNDHGRAPNGWGSEYSVRNVEPVSEPPPSRRPAKVHVPVQRGAQVFECGVEETPEAIILRPSGEVDLATVSILRGALTAATVTGRSIIVDMSGTRYMDSAGVHALFDHANTCKQHDYVLMLVAPQSTVQKVIEITHLDDAIPVLASVEVALDLVRSRTVPTKARETIAR